MTPRARPRSASSPSDSGCPCESALDVTGDDATQAQLQFVSVQRWVAGTTYDEEHPDRLRQRLDVLRGFLASIDTEPDSLVAFCFLRKKDTGERFVSTKRRGVVNEQIDLYVQAQGWTGKAAVANGNIVRSFLIHNGIPIGGKAWTGG
jgi:hypothetical protein